MSTIIDLTEGECNVYSKNEVVRICAAEELVKSGAVSNSPAPTQLIVSLACLPVLPACPSYTPDVSPPRPTVGICKASGSNSLTLVWHTGKVAPIVRLKSFELWCCFEPFEEWRKMGDIPAITPPMACLLSHIPPGVAHFTIRAINVEGRLGPFAVPASCCRRQKQDDNPKLF